jgi:hypothetical protein
MAELDVLRPEQEFETAPQHRADGAGLWRRSSASRRDGLDPRRVERELASLFPSEAAPSRRRARPTEVLDSGAQPFRESRRATRDKAALLTSTASSSIAALAEIQRVGRATKGLPIEGRFRFHVDEGVRGLRADGRRQALRLKAAKNRVREGEPPLGGLDRASFQSRSLPLADLIQEGTSAS